MKKLYWFDIALFLLYIRWTIIFGIASLLLGSIYPLIAGIVIDLLHFTLEDRK